MSAKPGAGLQLKVESSGDSYSVRMSGELDLASAGVLDTAIAELCADGATRIVLEMQELAFMDSTGLRSVLVGAELCEVNEAGLLIGGTSSQVERLFEVSGVGERLPRRVEDAEPA
jgi:anti-sigma B factor antagonist